MLAAIVAWFCGVLLLGYLGLIVVGIVQSARADRRALAEAQRRAMAVGARAPVITGYLRATPMPEPTGWEVIDMPFPYRAPDGTYYPEGPARRVPTAVARAVRAPIRDPAIDAARARANGSGVWGDVTVARCTFVTNDRQGPPAPPPPVPDPEQARWQRAYEQALAELDAEIPTPSEEGE